MDGEDKSEVCHISKIWHTFRKKLEQFFDR